MATFEANPDGTDDPWIETAAIEGYGFRIWHLMFFCFSGFTTLAVLLFCCIKVRIPRTKQQIEADYTRKKIAEKFKERLRLIQNQDMDAIDLQRALEIMQEDYRNLSSNINEPVADMYLPEYNKNDSNLEAMIAEPQQAPNFARKVSNVIRASRMKSQPTGSN